MKKPPYYDMLIEVWRAAAAEPIGLLIRVPDGDMNYWRTKLYNVRTFSNDSSFYDLEIGASRFPSESQLQIVHEQYGVRKKPNNSGDMDLRGVLDLDLPDE